MWGFKQLRLTLFVLATVFVGPLLAEQNVSLNSNDMEKNIYFDNDVSRHLAYLNTLSNLGTVELDQTYDELNARYMAKQSVDTKLFMAWILGTDGHAHTNPWAARKYLLEVQDSYDVNSNIKLLVKFQLSNLNKIIQLTDEKNEIKEKLRAITDIEQTLEQKSSGSELP